MSCSASVGARRWHVATAMVIAMVSLAPGPPAGAVSKPAAPSEAVLADRESSTLLHGTSCQTPAQDTCDVAGPRAGDRLPVAAGDALNLVLSQPATAVTTDLQSRPGGPVVHAGLGWAQSSTDATRWSLSTTSAMTDADFAILVVQYADGSQATLSSPLRWVARHLEVSGARLDRTALILHLTSPRRATARIDVVAKRPTVTLSVRRRLRPGRNDLRLALPAASRHALAPLTRPTARVRVRIQGPGRPTATRTVVLLRRPSRSGTPS